LPKVILNTEIPFVSFRELSHLPKLLDLKSGRARRISIGQTFKQIATFGDNSFGKTIDGLIIFTFNDSELICLEYVIGSRGPDL
jgi:hypothetical protein